MISCAIASRRGVGRLRERIERGNAIDSHAIARSVEVLESEARVILSDFEALRLRLAPPPAEPAQAPAASEPAIRWCKPNEGAPDEPETPTEETRRTLFRGNPKDAPQVPAQQRTTTAAPAPREPRPNKRASKPRKR